MIVARKCLTRAEMEAEADTTLIPTSSFTRTFRGSREAFNNGANVANKSLASTYVSKLLKHIRLPDYLLYFAGRELAQAAQLPLISITWLVPG